MAYMRKNGKGPYPCHAGEYCGNYLKGSQAYVRDDQTHENAQYIQKEWLARMRFGRPHSCGGFTVAEKIAQGWVGLYLKEDDPVNWRRPGDVLIDTPEELQEPPCLTDESEATDESA